MTRPAKPFSQPRVLIVEDEAPLVTMLRYNLERIGDHATNIAETLHYQITGSPLTDARPKKDDSSLTSVAYKEP